MEADAKRQTIYSFVGEKGLDYILDQTLSPCNRYLPWRRKTAKQTLRTALQETSSLSQLKEWYHTNWWDGLTFKSRARCRDVIPMLREEYRVPYD